ncbi:ribosomal protein S18-alanine N-acetyltransferase [Candidatus Bathyarchaeota archaeon A05DMB-2]|jgi:ribosomal-protein-alanine acetyltransferase|nr:ribosomal protein S18-alanine N-acetyltransferase [Candidatus Bathyarchaeota archaeon A05DMB-2]
MEITIEDLSIRMLDKLYEIEKQCFEKEAFTKQQIAYLVGDYNSIGLATRADGEIVGFAIARVDIRRNMRFGHILTVDVVPAYRRKGIARKLLTQIENILKQKGASECRLEVRENNTAALSLYQKLGYKKVGKLERYYGDAHGLYLRKILQ